MRSEHRSARLPIKCSLSGRFLLSGVFLSLIASFACAQTAPAPFTTGYRYDAARQVTGIISPADGAGYAATRNTYDAAGRLTQVERGALSSWKSESVSPAGWGSAFSVHEIAVKEYDEKGRLVMERKSSSTGGNPVLTQYSYDTVGRLECTAVRMNPAIYGSLPSSACTLGTQGSHGPDRITKLTYDAAGQLLLEQRAYGTSIQQNYARYAYTNNGRQDWVQDANNNRTDYTYDGFDRLSRITFPKTSVGAQEANSSDYEQYSYDNNGNWLTKRLRSGETISYAYDALDRLSRKTIPAGGGEVRYTYDNLGHSIQTYFHTGGDHSITNDFNGFGWLKTITLTEGSSSLVIEHEYDLEGNRVRTQWPDGEYVQYTYDGLNRMRQVRENGAVSGAGLLAQYSYDILSRRTGISRGNGTTTSYTYDGISRLGSLSQDLASTSRDVGISFGYNNASQVIQRSISNDAYAYFALNESKSYTRDGLNRYTNVGGMAYSYDTRGNLTSDGSRSFSYDLENRLTSVSGAASLSLSYDPMGRLLRSTSGCATTRYLYDGDRLIAEYNGSTILRRYVHGAGIDEPLGMRARV